jgi:isoprenylcysteine carboxyl methyltransferase (ICMT) family protein YpbQ
MKIRHHSRGNKVHPILWGFFSLAVLMRLTSLLVSRRNERVLRLAGAEEFGVRNSAVLAGLHVLFYMGAMAEGIWRRAQPDALSFLGIGLCLFGMLMLAVVIYQLNGLWTVKLYLAPGHTLNQNWLFRTVRHPNYFLNVLPELLGLALALKAWWVLMTVMPVYLISLGVRIAEEERVMQRRFPDYRRRTPAS